MSGCQRRQTMAPKPKSKLSNQKSSLSYRKIEANAKRILSDPKVKLARNAATRNSPKDIASNWEVYRQINHNFSHTVSPLPKATAQQISGRCWLFAATNMMRTQFMNRLKLEEFEFSQSFYFFYDKLEKSNNFLHNMIELADMPHDSRLVNYLTSRDLLGDGGQWSMFANIAKKYGVVPQSVYPDNAACANSRDMNDTLKRYLREYAEELRKMVQKKATPKALASRKSEMMDNILKMIIIHMGKPPSKFDFEYTDKNKKFSSIRNVTPLEFSKRHVKCNFDNMVTLVHSPRSNTPMNSLLTVEYLNNLVEGDPVEYVNVPINVMKKAAIDSIKDNIPVWMGCDVGQFFHRDLGIMDTDFYDFELFYGIPYNQGKADRMKFGESLMTHAMVFSGVNMVGGKANRWKVENSWGEKVGKKGYFIMSDKWFDEYMYIIAVDKKYLPQKVLNILDQEPITLPAWDPMGALA